MNQIEFIGFSAGILVSLSVLPQVIKSWKTKSTRDVSINWSIVNLAGQSLWIYYGFLINSISLIVMSAITLVLNVLMIILKLRFG